MLISTSVLEKKTGTSDLPIVLACKKKLKIRKVN